MDVLEAIKQRRSIRRFTEQAIERELLKEERLSGAKE